MEINNVGITLDYHLKRLPSHAIKEMKVERAEA
jgi:hypothetical protein